MRIFAFILFILFILFYLPLNAQIDWGSWSSVQLNYKANSKITLKAKPILRLKSNFSAYSDFSIDLISSYKINANWGINLLYRHFFIPNQGDREFWFFDLDYKYVISEKLLLTNKLRYHLAVNWNRNDPDFLRYNPQLIYKIKKNINVFTGVDYFYRLSNARVLAGGRYQLGVRGTLPSKAKLIIQYWRQIKHNDEYPIVQVNLVVLSFSFNIN